MGFHMYLKGKAKIKKEYIEFLNYKYMGNDYYKKEDIEDDAYEYDYNALPELYKPLYDTWRATGIGYNFTEFSVEDDVFTFEMMKKPYNHHGNLWYDYRIFMKETLLLISEKIEECVIWYDDYGFEEEKYREEDIRSI
jgi:hypothetical protein